MKTLDVLKEHNLKEVKDVFDLINQVTPSNLGLRYKLYRSVSELLYSVFLVVSTLHSKSNEPVVFNWLPVKFLAKGEYKSGFKITIISDDVSNDIFFFDDPDTDEVFDRHDVRAYDKCAIE